MKTMDIHIHKLTPEWIKKRKTQEFLRTKDKLINL